MNVPFRAIDGVSVPFPRASPLGWWKRPVRPEGSDGSVDFEFRPEELPPIAPQAEIVEHHVAVLLEEIVEPLTFPKPDLEPLVEIDDLGREP